jgi:hypothetical protein
MSATTTQLLSSGEFCKLRYDNIPVKSASFLSIPITQKCQILSCDILVANERYISCKLTGISSLTCYTLLLGYLHKVNLEKHICKIPIFTLADLKLLAT